jgi:hypothetical protein
MRQVGLGNILDRLTPSPALPADRASRKRSSLSVPCPATPTVGCRGGRCNKQCRVTFTEAAQMTSVENCSACGHPKFQHDTQGDFIQVVMAPRGSFLRWVSMWRHGRWSVRADYLLSRCLVLCDQIVQAHHRLQCLHRLSNRSVHFSPPQSCRLVQLCRRPSCTPV